MKDQLFWLDTLFSNGCFNQLRGQIGTFSLSQHPTDDATAVNVEDHVKVVIGPFFWAFQFGDVPRPDFIGTGRKQFRFRTRNIQCTARSGDTDSFGEFLGRFQSISSGDCVCIISDTFF